MTMTVPFWMVREAAWLSRDAPNQGHAMLDDIAEPNGIGEAHVGDPETLARIEARTRGVSPTTWRSGRSIDQMRARPHVVQGILM
jgi:hypothetical protein